MKLGLIADTHHYRDDRGRIYALTPVVRQLDLWAEWFDELIACAPLLPGPPPPTCSPYERLRVTLRPLAVGGGNTLRAKLGLIPRVIGWWPRIRAVIREVDAVHLRCPCNIGLIGILAVRGTARRRYAMYAGQWRDHPGQVFFSTLQRRLLARPDFGGPVAIYDDRGGAPHLVSSFSPSFTVADWDSEEETIRARIERLGRPRVGPARLISVGHLDANKSQATIVRALAILRAQGRDVRLACLGDGPLRQDLLRLVDELDLAGIVELPGGRPHSAVLEGYRLADLNVLASRTEGYPKVLAEGMVRGAVPVAADVGINDQILGHGLRGATFPVGDADALARVVGDLLDRPETLARMVEAARDYTRTVTLEAFLDLHRRVLAEHWGLEMRPAEQCTATQQRPIGGEHADVATKPLISSLPPGSVAERGSSK